MALTFGKLNINILILTCILQTKVYSYKCNSKELNGDLRCILIGEACSQESPCDIIFGFVCDNGKCKGPYNLTEAGVGENSVNVTWSSTPYHGNDYVIMYTSSFQESVSSWNTHAVVNATWATLYNLTPSTRYYIRVGPRPDPQANLSETLLIQTKAKSNCLYNGQLVPVGEKLVIDCAESCICAKTGHFVCAPVCSRSDLDLSGSSVCKEELNGSCCDRLNYCLYENCTYMGDFVQHEYSWAIDCAENCTCYDGDVTCVPLCNDVTAIPENCSHVAKSKTSDGCCDVYDCEDEEKVCLYNGTSYKADSWFSTGNCDLCRCSSSSVDVACAVLDDCFATALPESSAVCPRPFVAPNHCCQQVVCFPQTDPRHMFNMFTLTKHDNSSLIVRFNFISSKDESSAENAVFHFTTHASNTDINSWPYVTLAFQDAIASSDLDFDEFGNHSVLYKIDRSYVFIVPNLTLDVFYYTRFQLTFKQRDVIQPFLTPVWVVRHSVQSYPNKLTNPKATRLDVKNVTSSSATLKWTRRSIVREGITSFMIRYKALGDKRWSLTPHIIYTERTLTLTCLFHGKWYEARLLSFPGEHCLATTFFNTTSIRESTDPRFMLTINGVSIESDAMTVTWEPMSLALQDNVINIEIFWALLGKEEHVLKDCVSANHSAYTVRSLTPGTMYSIWLAVTLTSGVTILSERVHFVTTRLSSVHPHSISTHSLVVAITVTCISLVAMVIAIVTVVYVLKYKRRANYESHTAFENRIFQIYKDKDDRDL
ncbi:uncharacterized protein LOC128209800 isoform X2 [Mya arenaria]|uniref:uncharacterized protein LOC128209800 isoform X2 n=1 Tax=Mya arenaria TaxID=6604 RepID=UPI0022DF4F83|nr:uncharacterized protein LOC128209800 isoform X2 [Mya arenaria]